MRCITQARTIGHRARPVGFFNWLGFVAVATLGSVTFEKRPLKLYLINNGYLFLALLLMGAVLAIWS